MLSSIHVPHDIKSGKHTDLPGVGHVPLVMPAGVEIAAAEGEGLARGAEAGDCTAGVDVGIRTRVDVGDGATGGCTIGVEGVEGVGISTRVDVGEGVEGIAEVEAPTLLAAARFSGTSASPCC